MLRNTLRVTTLIRHFQRFRVPERIKSVRHGVPLSQRNSTVVPRWEHSLNCRRSRSPPAPLFQHDGTYCPAHSMSTTVCLKKHPRHF